MHGNNVNSKGFYIKPAGVCFFTYNNQYSSRQKHLKLEWAIGVVLLFVLLSVEIYGDSTVKQGSSSAVDRISDLTTAHFNLGKTYENKKDYVNALDSYFEALAYSTGLKNKLYNWNKPVSFYNSNGMSGMIYLAIADVFNILNRRGLSKKYLELALNEAINRKNTDLHISTLAAYGKFYFEDRDYQNALKYIDMSLSTEEKQKKYVCAVRSLYLKALILLKMKEELNKPVKNEPKPLDLLKTAVDRGLQLKIYEGLLPVMSEYIERLIANHLMDEASVYLRKIDEIYAPFYRYYFFYYYLQAIYYEEKGKLSEALDFFRKTANSLDRYFSGFNSLRYDFLAGKTSEIYSRMIGFYLKMYDRHPNFLYLKKAIYFSEIRNSYIYENVTFKNKSLKHFIDEKKKMEQELLDFNKWYIVYLRESDDKLKNPVYREKLNALKKQNEEMQEFIQESPMTYKKYLFSDFKLGAIRKKLSDNTLIVRYAVLNRSIYAFCLDKEKTTYFKLAEPTSRVLKLIRQIAGPFDEFSKGHVDYFNIHYDLQAANQLYNVLLGNILRTRPQINELLVIPDRELFNVPFEALVTGFNERKSAPNVIFSYYTTADYVLEKYAVSYSLSLFHLQKHTISPSKKKYEIVAFGAPIIKAPLSFKALPSAQQELTRISTIFGAAKSRIFTGERFTRENFEEIASQSRIIHFATHFIPNIQYPLYSALLFSPGKHRVPLYYAYEIYKLNLKSELVVLSACESSENYLMGFQGLRGMTASFKHAGVNALVVGMWPVDEHTSLLIPIFYSEYLKNGVEKIPRALRIAKLRLMKQSAILMDGVNISFAHPFIWANYILYHFNY